MKIGFDIDDDIRLIREVRDEVGPKIGIRVDPNEGWSVYDATRALRELEDVNLEYVEEPIDMNNSMRSPIFANRPARGSAQISLRGSPTTCATSWSNRRRMSSPPTSISWVACSHSGTLPRCVGFSECR